MIGNEEYWRNNAAYLRMKETIGQTYPKGWWVGIFDEQVVAAAADIRELQGDLRQKGYDPRRVLHVEAGVDPPDWGMVPPSVVVHGDRFTS